MLTSGGNWTERKPKNWRISFRKPGVYNNHWKCEISSLKPSKISRQQKTRKSKSNLIKGSKRSTTNNLPLSNNSKINSEKKQRNSHSFSLAPQSQISAKKKTHLKTLEKTFIRQSRRYGTSINNFSRPNRSMSSVTSSQMMTRKIVWIPSKNFWLE